jgi:predicted RNase H-like HicB family nuclease
MRRSSYCEVAVTVRVLYHQDPQGWWAESPEIEGWTVAGESYEEVRQLVEDGVSFALASAAEERGDGFDESCFASVSVEHYVPAPA